VWERSGVVAEISPQRKAIAKFLSTTLSVPLPSLFSTTRYIEILADGLLKDCEPRSVDTDPRIKSAKFRKRLVASVMIFGT